jgi:hypothetical protein
MAKPEIAPDGIRIALQVGSELRITSRGDVVMGNPEIEVAEDRRAADAVLLYKFDKNTGDHVFWLLEPLADRAHQRVHQPND